MSRFHCRSITLRGQLVADAEVADVFPLFSPEGERGWVPGWDPELLHPPGAVWEEGQIFRTREESEEAVWLVTRLDRERWSVEYHRVHPERYVARISVACRPLPDGRTEVSTIYSFVGLSEAGNREIDTMTQQTYDEKMSRWSEWVARHLAGRQRRRDG